MKFTKNLANFIFMAQRDVAQYFSSVKILELVHSAYNALDSRLDIQLNLDCDVSDIL